VTSDRVDKAQVEGARTRQTRWIVVRRRRGAPTSIPVYVRCSELLSSAVNGGVA
jgi:hypothetical protein